MLNDYPLVSSKLYRVVYCICFVNHIGKYILSHNHYTFYNNNILYNIYFFRFVDFFRLSDYFFFRYRQNEKKVGKTEKKKSEERK